MPTVFHSILKIEVMKQKLINLGKNKGISHPEVIVYSQKLDVALNEYDRILKSEEAAIQ